MPSFDQIFLAAVILVLGFLVSSGVMWLLKRSGRLTAKTKTTFDDELMKLLQRPVHSFFLLGAIVLALAYLFPGYEYHGYGHEDLAIVLLFVWSAYSVNRVVIGLIHWHEQEMAKDIESVVKPGTFKFLENIISAAVWGLALLLVLNHAGVDVTAVMAGLGIAGIAIALALQSTLTGIFSAIHLAIDKPVRQGDFIQLQDGTEGFVEDISMRSTRIRTFANNLVIVPNKVLSDMVITNYYLPQEEIGVVIPLRVAYEADFEKVEKLAIEVAVKVIEEHTEKSDCEPYVRFKEFGENGADLIVVLRVKRFIDQYIVKHEFMKAIKAAFDKAKIQIPVQQLDVHMVERQKKHK